MLTAPRRFARLLMNKNSRIFVAGHRGLVGSAIVRRLHALGFDNLALRTHSELDLADPTATRGFFETEQPEFVIVAAAKVGGIHANSTLPGTFIHTNLAIQTNVLHEACRAGVKRLLFLGSSCIYPRECPQPIHEDYLLTGQLEPTNSAYAVAKIAGIEMCRSYNRQYGTHFLAAMPTNMYGPGDNFDLETSHVLPALLRKTLEATLRDEDEVVVWGTGKPRREFLHSDDLADGCVMLLSLDTATFDAFLSSHYYPLINIGYGEDITIAELAQLIARKVEFAGRLRFDSSRPDGTMRKLMDSSRMRSLGWKPKIDLEQGIEQMIGRLRSQSSVAPREKRTVSQ